MLLIVVVVAALIAIGAGDLRGGAAAARRAALAVSVVLAVAAPLYLAWAIAHWRSARQYRWRIAALVTAAALFAWGAVSEILTTVSGQDIAQGLAIIAGYVLALILICATPAELFAAPTSDGDISRSRSGIIVGIALAAGAILLLYIGGGPTESAPGNSTQGTASARFPMSQIVEGPAIPGAPEVRSCGQLLGGASNSEYIARPCESGEATFKVVQVASEPGACVKDADQRYFHHSATASWAVCLDYNWKPNSCLSIQGWDVKTISCDATNKGGFRVAEILDGATSINACRSSGGFPHAQRRFTVCTDTIA